MSNLVRGVWCCRGIAVGLACVALGGVGLGCRKVTSGIEGGAASVPVAAPGLHVSKYVICHNRGLAKTITLVDLKTTTTETKLIRASASILSTSAQTQQVLCRFSWFDSEGFEIDPGAKPWQPVLLYGNETKTVQDVAPSSAAQEFRIHIREK